MRNKEWKVVVTFESTNHAIALENVFKEQGVPGRLIPVPRQLQQDVVWHGVVARAVIYTKRDQSTPTVL